jgi:acyl dehydratase
MSDTLDGIDGVRAAVGRPLGATSWHTITQEQIDAFAVATGDQQWIHVDPVRASEGPFGATIAHGYMTLAMVTALLDELVRIDGVSMSINYGVNRVRFPAPARVGSRLRLSAVIESCDQAAVGYRLVISGTVEIEGADKPACVVECIALLVP